MQTEAPGQPNTAANLLLEGPPLAAWLDRLPEAARGPAGSLLGLMLASSVAFFLAERETNHKVDSLWDALWWALATVSTVGYGDIVPVTGPGRAVGSLLTVVGGRWYQQLIDSDTGQERDVGRSLREILERLERIEQSAGVA